MNGLYINTSKSNCSIYSSGLMIYDILAQGPYHLDYVEINKLDINSLHNGVIRSRTPLPYNEFFSSYDFYIFNYHPITMVGLEGVDSSNFVKFNAKTICIILEMNKDNPWAFIRPQGFTDYLVLDPTLSVPDKNVHAFPRPLSKSRNIKKIQNIPEVPLIGSFGFATQDKGFHLIVKAVSEEFEKANIRINFSPSTYANQVEGMYIQEFKNRCSGYLREGINLQLTYDYMSEDNLIDWCGENTINCFFYMRNLPGLAAATDQAIISGAPLAVSENTTFRHIHTYVKPYPHSSLRQLIIESQDGVEQMQLDWSSQKFLEKFIRVIKK